MAQSEDLGSVGLAFELDIAGLKKQANAATTILRGIQKELSAAAEVGAGAEAGGILSALTGSGKAAGGALKDLISSGGNLGAVSGQLKNVAGGFTQVAGAAGASGASIVATGGIILAILAVLAAAVVAVKALGFAFQFLTDAATGGAQLATTNTALNAVAKNSGVSEKQVRDFSAALSDMNIFGNNASESILNLLNAQLPLDESTKNLAASAQNLATAYGKDTATTFATITKAITSLNPILLEQFGITENLDVIYDRYAASLGRTSASLSEHEKKLALVNLINQKGAQFAGVYADAQGNVQKKFEQIGSRVSTITAALGTALQPALLAIVGPLEKIATAASDWLTSPDAQAKLTALGNRIAQYVTPAVNGFIGILRSIPWTVVIDATYRWLQGLYLLAQVAWNNAQIFINFGKAAIRAIALPIGGIKALIGVFQSAARVAASAWQVISGKGSIKDLGKSIQAANESMATYVNATLVEAFDIGKDLVLDSIDDIQSGVQRGSETLAKMMNGFNLGDWWASLPGAAAASTDANKNAMEDISSDALKAMRKLQEQLAKENEEFARKQAEAAADFEEQLAELTSAHRDNIAGIRKDIAKEASAYEKSTNERTDAYRDQMDDLAKEDRDRKNDVNKQLSEELAKGRFADKTKIARLKARLNYEDAENKKAVEQVQTNFEKETAAAKEQYDTRIAELQDALSKEEAIQARHADDFARFRDYQIKDDITRLKDQYAKRKAEDERAHKEKIADLIKNGAAEAGQYASNGAKNASGYLDALGGGLSSGAGALNTQARAQGDNVMANAQSGAETRRGGWASTLQSIINAGLSSIGNFAGTAWNWGATLIQHAINGVYAMTGALSNTFWTVFNNAANWVGGLWNAAWALVTKLGRAIYDVFPWGIKQAFQNAWGAAGFPRFARGGIVQGTPGVDNVTARVSAGEMILNKSQQQRMFGLLNGSISPGAPGLGNSGGGVIIENVTVSLPNVRNADDFGREMQLKFATMRT